MNDHQSGSAAPAVNIDKLAQRLDDAIQALEESRSFTKAGKLPRVLDIARRVLLQPDGCRIIEERAERLELAGVFAGTDWAEPGILLPTLTTYSLQSQNADTVVIEAFSELRLLAVARNSSILRMLAIRSPQGVAWRRTVYGG